MFYAFSWVILGSWICAPRKFKLFWTPADEYSAPAWLGLWQLQLIVGPADTARIGPSYYTCITHLECDYTCCSIVYLCLNILEIICQNSYGYSSPCRIHLQVNKNFDPLYKQYKHFVSRPPTPPNHISKIRISFKPLTYQGDSVMLSELKYCQNLAMSAWAKTFVDVNRITSSFIIQFVPSL